MIYLIILVIILGFVYKYDFSGHALKHYYGFYFILGFLVLVAGLRYRMAPDSVAYMTSFNKEIRPLDDLSLDYFTNSRYQPFWLMLNSICKSFGNYYVVQFFASAIFNICVFYFIKKISLTPYTAILFYYITVYHYFNMEIVRESLAIGFFLIACLNYSSKKYYYYVFIAFMFHHFAFFLFFIKPIVNPKIKLAKKVVILSLLVLISVLVVDPLFIVDSLLTSISSVDVTLYDLQEFEISILGYIYMALKISPIFIAFFYVRHHRLENTFIFNYNALIALSFFYVAIVLIRFISIPFIERVGNYFIFFVITLTSHLILHYLKSKRYILSKFYFFILTIVICCYQIFPFLEVNDYFGVPLYHRYYPYSSIIERRVDSNRELMTEMEGKEW